MVVWISRVALEANVGAWLFSFVDLWQGSQRRCSLPDERGPVAVMIYHIRHRHDPALQQSLPPRLELAQALPPRRLTGVEERTKRGVGRRMAASPNGRHWLSARSDRDGGGWCPCADNAGLRASVPN